MTRFPLSLRLGAGTLALAALVLLPGALLAAPPANDSCGGAVVLPASGPFPYAAAAVDATQASNDVSGDPEFICNTKFPSPVPANAVTKSVWYTFTPAFTETYQIDTIGSTPGGIYDTILGVYTGICGTLTPVTDGCNDDTAGSLQSMVRLRLNAGTTYYILVSGLGSRDPFNINNIVASPGGTLRLNVSTVAVSYPYAYVLPSVAHAQGATLYVSDLNVTSADTTDGSFVIQFLNHGSFGDTAAPSPQPTNAPTTIRAGGSVQFNDVLANGFGLNVSTNPYGALLVRSTVKLLIGARTYTTAAGGGTFGQYAMGVDAATDLLNANETGRFIGVRESASSRSNLVVFNTTATACSVKFEVKNASGELYTGGSLQIRTVPPNTMVQASGLRNLFTVSEDILNASVLVTNMTAGCKIGGIAYVIDGNPSGGTPGTNDPAAIPLQK